MVEGKFNLDNNYLIRNVPFLCLVLKLIPFLELLDQHHLLETLILLVSRSVRNLSLCCKAGLFSQLLDLLLSLHQRQLLNKVANLLEMLGTHQTTPKEVKKLFHMLTIESVAPMILSSTQQMILTTVGGPRVFFDLDGSTSVTIPQH